MSYWSKLIRALLTEIGPSTPACLRNARMSQSVSPNFEFLNEHQPVLIRLAQAAERFVFEDPNTSLIKSRQLAESLAKAVASQAGLPCGQEVAFADVERELKDRGFLDRSLHQIMRGIRLAGNSAVHELSGSKRESLYQLKMVRQIAVWFHKTVTGKMAFSAGPFIPPPEPVDADESLKEQLRLLQETLVLREAELQGVKLHADELKIRIEEIKTRAETAFLNEQAAMELAAETEESAKQKIAEYEKWLVEISAEKASSTPAEKEAVVARSQKAASDVDLDEADTRKLIDQQLREAGWEVDTQELTYARGYRPAKDRNLAIAEWPTEDGIADYVLFAGLTPLGTVEAKRKRKNARSALDQAERYSKSFSVLSDHHYRGPWQEYRIPFVYSTNGNPYHRQLIDQSGIWFRDVRESTNHPRALSSWHSPNGLLALLAQDIKAANNKLLSESRDYLPLYDYQRDAIAAVEKAIAAGQTEILLAMATGTGKTRTAICLLYRLVKASRFNRVLFVVDRRSLGEQAMDAFKDVKLENLQSFPEIYDVKELGDLKPDRETKLHVCTIQAMVKRVLESDADNPAWLPIDQYDCIIIDECHRGYILDKDMSEEELTYRDQLDYISKYRRILDHFDAVRIGLTATPALHTTEIFGKPVFQYSYRQAVIDRRLVDHEPPYIIRTELSERGMHWGKGDVVKRFDTLTKSVSTDTSPDEIDIDIEGFNKIAITENFNKVVCDELAKHIDPFEPGKTLIFCVLDSHADMVVRLLTEALEARKENEKLPHDAVKKITGDVERTSEVIRRFKNEQFPNIAVTVDLLTTGIDVPAISNIVFIRCTKSRILFEQMIGRATRLCKDLYGDGEDKEYFRIFDAVGIYAKLQKHTDMKPVVVNPKTTFAKLVGYLEAETDPELQKSIGEQLVAKLRRKFRSIERKWLQTFEYLTGGSPESIADLWESVTIAELKSWLTEHRKLIFELDKIRPGTEQLISEHSDQLVSVDRGYGESQKPADYLESFKEFLKANEQTIPLLTLVAQRPSDLTRKSLRELQIQLDEAGFSELAVKSAVRDATNQEIATNIVGMIRYAMLGEPLIPYDQRVDRAIQLILASQNWEPKQRQWLERIGKQIKENTLLDHELIDTGEAFKDKGGFVRLNRVFDGKLEEILRKIMEVVWQTAG